MSPEGKPIVIEAGKNEEGELDAAFDPRPVDSEDSANLDSRLMADRHAGMVAWGREADRRWAMGEYEPPVRFF